MATRARRAPAAAPKRTLFLLFLIVAALFGGIAASVQWGNPAGQWSPKLGLDLEGGRQIVLQPVLGKDQKVNSGQVNQAVNIIRNRVDGTGVSEAEVSTLGGSSIVVAIPGNPSKEVLDSLAQSSKLMFRAVVQTGQPTIDQTTQPTLPLPPTTAAASSSAAKSSAATSSSTASTSGAKSTSTVAPQSSGSAKSSTATSTGANAGFPEALVKAASSTPSGTASSTVSSTTAATTPKPTPTLPGATPTSSSAAAAAAGKPTSPSDTAWAQQTVDPYWIRTGLAKKGDTYSTLLASISCSNTNAKAGPTATQWREASAQAPAAAPTVACSTDGSTTYLLGPSEVDGTMISDASFGQVTNSQGIATGEVAVNLEFDGKGKDAFGKMTTRLASMQGDQNKSAITIDGVVISDPGTNGAIVDGRAQISGGFTTDSARLLADQLKYGALPFSFKELTSDQISPQLGTDQLQKGLMAGAIGLLLVILYSLFQYRALGLVTVASLVAAGVVTYGAVTFLGFANNFRLTMAGVTGLIVSIGITADSFIVYFERVRDEVRSGRPLKAAVETGWKRAKRTIIISDAVNFLAAAVLYVLSESSVKAFAFTLGVTTLIDLLIVTMFTHPVLTLLAHTKFFGGGHRFSGFDPDRLGARGVTYAGRGRVTIADRKAAAAGGDL